MNLDYLAGFTDGEGCFSVCGRGPRIGWGQNAPEVLKEIRVFLESMGLHTNWTVIKADETRRRPNPITHLWISRKCDCGKLCKILYPYLITKKADCGKLLKWIQDRPYQKNLNVIPDHQIIDLWKQGYRGIYIANKFNISRSKLSNISKRLGIVFPSGNKTENGKRISGLSKKSLREQKWRKEKSITCLDCGSTIWKYGQGRCKSCAQKYRHETKPESFKASNTKFAQNVISQ